jgi:septal ring factor EnvC (AmiA/AmiB activator)
MRVNLESIKNFLSNKITLLIIMVCFVFCIQVFTLFKNESETQKVNYIKKEIKSLKDDVNEIHKSEKALDKKIDTFNYEIKNIHEAVTINNTKIENLKKYEKVQNDKFKSYDARMWEKYFADRYASKSTNSTETRE